MYVSSWYHHAGHRVYGRVRHVPTTGREVQWNQHCCFYLTPCRIHRCSPTLALTMLCFVCTLQCPAPSHLTVAVQHSRQITARGVNAGVRFFRSCAIQCLVSPSGPGHHITPSTIQSVDVQECDPATLALLLQLIEGRAPKKVTLQQACDIFSVLEYCLADSLFEIIPNYLEPLMEELSAREVGFMTAPVSHWLLMLRFSAFVACRMYLLL